YDAAGNSASSVTSTVTVSNDSTAPSVTLTAPTSGSTVSGTINLTCSASDNVGVTKVEYWCDDTKLCATVTAAPFSTTDDTKAMSNGSHTYKAKAFDAAGNTSTSTASTVTVTNTTGTPGQLQWVKTGLAPSGYSAQCWGVAADASGNAIAV